MTKILSDPILFWT